MNESATKGLVYCDVHAWTKPSRHHIIPRSRGGTDSYLSLQQKLLWRLRKLLGLPSMKGNRNNISKRACGECHPRSHLLFANRMPDEIIEQLVEGLWNGQKKWVYIYLWRDFVKTLRRILGLRPSEKKGKVAPQHLQTDRLHRTLKEELRVRRIVREFGLWNLEGEFQIRKVLRDLAPGSLCIVNEETKEVLLSVEMNGARTPQELLEEILGGRELGPYESIRPVIWRKRPANTS